MQHTFTYDKNIYRNTDAFIILDVLRQYISYSSVLDVGCGIGSWLRVLEDDFGIQDYLGIDASSFDPSIFKIEKSRYLQKDLQKPLDLNRQFDLAICLEVAEHLPEHAATTIVESLATHSDVILFSAAIPGQGGQMHINEQWHSWWKDYFEKAGYNALDLIRPRIWNHLQVLPWYKQNILLYVKKEHPLTLKYEVAKQLDLVHPEIYLAKLHTIKELAQVQESAVFNPTFRFALKTLAKSILITPFKNDK